MPARRAHLSAPRRTRGHRTIAAVLAAVLAAFAAAAATTAVAPGAIASPSSSSSSARPSATTDSVTLHDPIRPDISLTVTPPPSTVRQGDTVHLHFAGLGNGDSVSSIGTCPAGLPVADMDLGPDSAITGSLACQARFLTGITGDPDYTSANNPTYSPYLRNLYSALDKTLDVDFLVGSGTSANKPPTATIRYKDKAPTILDTLTCDASHACTIGFVVSHAHETKPGRLYWNDLTSLTFSPPAATGADTRGCAGLDATRTISAAGPDRLLTPLSTLDRGYCEHTTSPIPVSLIPSANGEGDATGVPAVGKTADLAFIGSPALTKTPASADQLLVPIALNAVSIAQFGGFVAPSITTGQIGYGTVTRGALALSPADVAGIVLHDFSPDLPSPLPTTVAAGEKANPLAAAILGRAANATELTGLDPSLIGLPFYAAPTVTYGTGENSTAIALSSYLGSAAPSAWTFPANPINASLKRSGKAVGAITDFSTLVDQTPAVVGNELTSVTSSISGLYAAKLSKDISRGTGFAGLCPNFSASASTTGPDYAAALTRGCLRFGVMDTQTAASMSFASARLPAGSSYVAPTSASMQAAAAETMGAGGFYGGTSDQAYPLTFVEYAVVPKAPLLDDACALRGQQALLKSFLTYAIGEGQGQLSPGLAPLSSSLHAQAVAAIAGIGTGTPTGTCAPKPTPKPTPTPTATPTPTPTASASQPPVLTDGSSGGGGGFESSGSGTGSSSTGTGSTSPSGSGLTAQQQAAASSSNAESRATIAAKPVALEVASFQGAASTSTTSTTIGLVILVILVAAGAAWSSGNLSAARLRARLRNGLHRSPS